MMTVITEVGLNEGTEPEWDEAMRERLEAATTRPGWIRGQPVIPLDGMNRRLIIGTCGDPCRLRGVARGPGLPGDTRTPSGSGTPAGSTTCYVVIADVQQ